MLNPCERSTVSAYLGALQPQQEEENCHESGEVIKPNLGISQTGRVSVEQQLSPPGLTRGVRGRARAGPEVSVRGFRMTPGSHRLCFSWVAPKSLFLIVLGKPRDFSEPLFPHL